jgi:hypothetical protein
MRKDLDIQDLEAARVESMQCVRDSPEIAGMIEAQNYRKKMAHRMAHIDAMRLELRDMFALHATLCYDPAKPYAGMARTDERQQLQRRIWQAEIDLQHEVK